MEYYQSKTDFINLQSPFNCLYTDNDYPLSKKPEIVGTLEEILDVECTLSGDIDLDYVAFRIKLNDYAFVSTGAWLWKVRYFKSYKKTHKRFKDWCEYEVGKSYHTCLRMINATTVWIKLVSMGFEILPSSIAQCYVLRDLDDEELYEAWSTVLKELEPHQFSSGSISTLLNGSEEKVNTSVYFPIDLFNKLSRTAHNFGMTIIDLVANMYDEIYQKVADLPLEVMQRWDEDLQEIVASFDGNEPNPSVG